MTPEPPTAPAPWRGLQAGKTLGRGGGKGRKVLWRGESLAPGPGPWRGAGRRGKFAEGAGAPGRRGGVGKAARGGSRGGQARSLPSSARPAFMAFSRNGKGVGAKPADAPRRMCALSPGCLRQARRHCILLASTGVLEQQGEEEQRVISQAWGGRAGGRRASARAGAAVRPTALFPGPQPAILAPGPAASSLPAASAPGAAPQGLRPPRLRAQLSVAAR